MGIPEEHGSALGLDRDSLEPTGFAKCPVCEWRSGFHLRQTGKRSLVAEYSSHKDTMDRSVARTSRSTLPWPQERAKMEQRAVDTRCHAIHIVVVRQRSDRLAKCAVCESGWNSTLLAADRKTFPGRHAQKREDSCTVYNKRDLVGHVLSTRAILRSAELALRTRARIACTTRTYRRACSCPIATELGTRAARAHSVAPGTQSLPWLAQTVPDCAQQKQNGAQPSLSWLSLTSVASAGWRLVPEARPQCHRCLPGSRALVKQCSGAL